MLWSNPSRISEFMSYIQRLLHMPLNLSKRDIDTARYRWEKKQMDSQNSRVCPGNKTHQIGERPMFSQVTS
jgi:hypothetical protein